MLLLPQFDWQLKNLLSEIGRKTELRWFEWMHSRVSKRAGMQPPGNIEKEYRKIGWNWPLFTGEQTTAGTSSSDGILTALANVYTLMTCSCKYYFHLSIFLRVFIKDLSSFYIIIHHGSRYESLARCIQNNFAIPAGNWSLLSTTLRLRYQPNEWWCHTFVSAKGDTIGWI